MQPIMRVCALGCLLFGMYAGAMPGISDAVAISLTYVFCPVSGYRVLCGSSIRRHHRCDLSDHCPPLITGFALLLVPKDYFVLALMGMLPLCSMSGGCFAKVVFFGLLGMVVGCVGIEPFTATQQAAAI